MNDELHLCHFSKYDLERGWYGIAINRCEENDKGELWVDNTEYGNRVNFCPFCGYEAKRKFKTPETATATP